MPCSTSISFLKTHRNHGGLRPAHLQRHKSVGAPLSSVWVGLALQVSLLQLRFHSRPWHTSLRSAFCIFPLPRAAAVSCWLLVSRSLLKIPPRPARPASVVRSAPDCDSGPPRFPRTKRGLDHSQ